MGAHHRTHISHFVLFAISALVLSVTFDKVSTQGQDAATITASFHRLPFYHQGNCMLANRRVYESVIVCRI